MVTILSAGLPGWEVLTLQDFPGAPEPEEVGLTYAQNAAIKAESAHAFTGEICIADDAGLEIDALDGAPGLYSKRFGGENLPFAQKIQMVLDELKAVPEAKRGARFVCAVAIAGPNLPLDQEAHERVIESIQSGPPGAAFFADVFQVFGPRIFTATCEGRIATVPSGMNGFGYDPIFVPAGQTRTFGEMPADEKLPLTHRARAFEKFLAALT